MIYLDNAATSAVRREVLEAMWPYLTDAFGNPSSTHGYGKTAKSALDWARDTVASLIGAVPSEIVFTGGGTEANNLCIKGLALANPRGRQLAISAIEHPSVTESARYLQQWHDFSVSTLPVDSQGIVSPAVLPKTLSLETSLVSVMTASNEVGTVQPVTELAEIAHAQGALFHTDGVQAAGWFPYDVHAQHLDALSMSGHKLGAPQGIGMAWLNKRHAVEPLVHGGGQQSGIRSGTENVAGAVGLAVALQLATETRKKELDTLTGLRDDFIAQVQKTVPGAVLTGHPTQRLPTHVSFCFENVGGEAILLELERQGILCSSGSACAAGKSEPSPTLLAMGFTAELADTAVRFTWNANIDRQDLSRVASALREAVPYVRHLHKVR